MSLLSENVIPGEHGKVFETNAKSNVSLEEIKTSLLQLNGVKDVIINSDAFPCELTVHTSTLVTVKDIQDIVTSIGFHAIPKSLFAL